MVLKYKCEQCGKPIKETKDFYKVSAVSKKNKVVSEKNFCSLQCVNRYSELHKDNPHAAHNLEQEIKEAVQEEKEHVEEGQKIAEQQQEVDEIKQETASYTKKAILKSQQYRKKKPSQDIYSAGKKPHPDYIEQQEFYIKNPEDFDKIKDTIQEIKSQDPSMARVDDSDVYEIEPETKKLKLRKMPRTVLDRLKEKRVILEYFKIL